MCSNHFFHKSKATNMIKYDGVIFLSSPFPRFVIVLASRCHLSVNRNSMLSVQGLNQRDDLDYGSSAISIG